MSNNNLVINLEARQDVDGQTFYVGKLKSPVSIDCQDGVVFLLFIADTGCEQLQIAAMDKKKNMVIEHFEELWEQCELFHKTNTSNSSNIIDECLMKLNVYKILSQRPEFSEDEKIKLKEKTLGEILLVLTNLSLVDNINVFEALASALKFKNVENISRG